MKLAIFAASASTNKALHVPSQKKLKPSPPSRYASLIAISPSILKRKANKISAMRAFPQPPNHRRGPLPPLLKIAPCAVLAWSNKKGPSPAGWPTLCRSLVVVVVVDARLPQWTAHTHTPAPVQNPRQSSLRTLSWILLGDAAESGTSVTFPLSGTRTGSRRGA